MFRPKCRCVVVVGAQWGDEGKGKIVDVLAERADLVVRYQGGANAGHTVVKGEDEFILHQIPSGILHPNTRCGIGNGVVLDPETFIAERDGLRERGIDTDSRIFVSERAHIVLPYHKMLDRAAEKCQRIGTTGRGIGPTYEDKIGRRGIRVGDLRDVAALRETLRQRVARVNQILTNLAADEAATLDAQEAFLEGVAGELEPMMADMSLVTFNALQDGDRVLLEGAQGALLDVDHGTYPFVTSSNTIAGGAAVGTGIGPTAIDAVLGVVKAYTTRVGNGPLPTEAEGDDAEHLRKLGGEFGATTGRPRRCGWFDAIVVRYAVRVNGLTDLAVTKLDVLDTLGQIKVCIGYRLDGELITDMPSDSTVLTRVTPVYETLEGWGEPTTAARRLADLPSKARVYLDWIEDLVKVPISYVSVGTRRDQIINIR